MATWNRNVEAGDPWLVITKTSQNPDPPPPPERIDTGGEIWTFPADRAGGGAKILYHARGDVTLTGITMKSGGTTPDGLSVSVNPAGKLMTLTDTGDAGTVYEYYVVGRANGTDSQTEDPRIHNQH
jgi:hypothetical protein